MNRENIQKVLDYFKSGAMDDHFNMSRWKCGTYMCIGGLGEHLMRVEGSTKYLSNNGVGNDCAVGKWLGLHTDLVAEEHEPWFQLFYPYTYIYSKDPNHAIRVLEHLLETGEVDWSIIPEEEANSENRVADRS